MSPFRGTGTKDAAGLIRSAAEKKGSSSGKTEEIDSLEAGLLLLRPWGGDLCLQSSERSTGDDGASLSSPV